MENCDLNKAHEFGRRASKLIKKGKYSESIECHLKAASILQDILLSVSEDSLAIRSLEEQVKFHKRQAELTTVLKEVMEKQKNLLKMTEKIADNGGGGVYQRVHYQHSQHQQQCNREPFFHSEIIRNFDEADSLLQFLSERKISNEDSPENRASPVIEKAIEFTIRPKNESEIIEELQTLNTNLRTLVDKLLNELNEARNENKLLRKRLEFYEGKENKSDEANGGATKGNILHLKENIPEKVSQKEEMIKFGEEKSEIVINKDKITYSQHQQFKNSSLLEALDQIPSRQLPELEPLESPDLDFLSFT